MQAEHRERGQSVGLARLIAAAGVQAKPRPVERWDPPDCRSVGMHIASDGTWLYQGSPIGRQALVRLFASILRREADGGHVLVTPVEKVTVTVDDAPFVAVEIAVTGSGTEQAVAFRTNVGDVVTAGAEHPLRFEAEPSTGGLKPYVGVRGGLEALATRALAYELVAASTEKDGMPGLWSGGVFFPFPACDLD